MTFFFLPINFASQSKHTPELVISHLEKKGCRIAVMVHAGTYPQRGVLRLEGLLPERHYLLQGAAQLFCRADAAGTAWIELSLQGPSLLLVTPVI